MKRQEDTETAGRAERAQGRTYVKDTEKNAWSNATLYIYALRNAER